MTLVQNLCLLRMTLLNLTLARANILLSLFGLRPFEVLTKNQEDDYKGREKRCPFWINLRNPDGFEVIFNANQCWYTQLRFSLLKALNGSYILFDITWPKNNHKYGFHTISIAKTSPSALCFISLTLHTLDLLQVMKVSLPFYPFLFPIVNRYGHIVPLTYDNYNTFQNKFCDENGWKRMTVQSRRRGAATAAHNSKKLNDMDVTFFLRHSPSVSEQYVDLSHEKKLHAPLTLALDAQSQLQSMIKKKNMVQFLSLTDKFHYQI